MSKGEILDKIDLDNEFDLGSEEFLIDACRSKDAKFVKDLIESGLDPRSETTDTRMTPLMSACSVSDNTEVIKVLLRELHKRAPNLYEFVAEDQRGGINRLNIEGRTALSFACYNGNDEAISILIDERAALNKGKILFERLDGNQIHLNPFFTVMHLMDPEKRSKCVNVFIESAATTQRANGSYWNDLLDSLPERYFDRVADLLTKENKKLLSAILPEGGFLDQVNKKLAEKDLLETSRLRSWREDLTFNGGCPMEEFDKNRSVAVQLGMGDKFPSIPARLAIICTEEEFEHVKKPLSLKSSRRDDNVTGDVQNVSLRQVAPTKRQRTNK